jgi:hypothetical protein
VSRGGSSLVEHWLFGSGSSPGLASTAAALAERAWHGTSDPGGSAGRARCWVLRERPHGLTSIGPNLPRQLTVEAGYRPYLENCIVDASIICSCQVNKGTRWMPWYQEPKKDVGACDKPRGVGNQT